jgi:hypothetical protein
VFFRFKRSVQNGVLYEHLQIAESPDETSIVPIVAGFLALRQEAGLQKRLGSRGPGPPGLPGRRRPASLSADDDRLG